MKQTSAFQSLQTSVPNQIDESLSSHAFEQLFGIKDAFPQEPGKSWMKDMQFPLHSVLLPVSGQLVLVRVPGDLVDRDGKGPIVKFLF